MVFQVVTDRPTRPARVGRVRIGFHMSRKVESTPVAKVQTETGSMRVSTPEATAFDLVRFAPAAGHLNNVATVLDELAEKLDPAALAKLAHAYAVPEAQRLGYLLELAGHVRQAKALEPFASKAKSVKLLDPSVKSFIASLASPLQKNPKWMLVINEPVEIDS